MARWLRKYELLIGTPLNTATLLNKNSAFIAPVDLDEFLQATGGGNAYKITDLHISFRITKTNGKDPNDCEIKIYNLSDTVVNYLNNNIANDLCVSLVAGYGELGDLTAGEMKTIFKGTVVKVLDKPEAPNRVTTLKLKDGLVNITEAVSSQVFRAGTPPLNVITGLVNDMGLPIGSIVTDDPRQTEPLVGNYTAFGKTSDIIHRFTKDRGLKFSVQDGKAYITPTNATTQTLSSYISPASGLIGSPEPLSDSGGKSNQAKTPRDGVSFKCQLDGAILPDTTIYLESKNYNEAFKVSKVVHSGDYESGNWETQVECLRTNVVGVSGGQAQGTGSTGGAGANGTTRNPLLGSWNPVSNVPPFNPNR